MNNSVINNDCPPLMSSQRHITDYRPNCELNALIQHQNGIKDSYTLKNFMTHKALKLQQINDRFYEQKNTCNSCTGYLPDPNGTVSYWDNYSKGLQYGNVMTQGCSSPTQASKVRVLTPKTYNNF